MVTLSPCHSSYIWQRNLPFISLANSNQFFWVLAFGWDSNSSEKHNIRLHLLNKRSEGRNVSKAQKWLISSDAFWDQSWMLQCKSVNFVLLYITLILYLEQFVPHKQSFWWVKKLKVSTLFYFKPQCNYWYLLFFDNLWARFSVRPLACTSSEYTLWNMEVWLLLVEHQKGPNSAFVMPLQSRHNVLG